MGWRFWPFKRRIQASQREVGPPPVLEAAPADMSHLLRIRNDETVAIEAARSRLAVIGLALAFGFTMLGVRAVHLAAAGPAEAQVTGLTEAAPVRGDLLDRSGQVLATTLTTYSLHADPRVVWNARESAEALAAVLPELDVDKVAEDLASRRHFVWIRRNLTPRQREAVFALGLPGLNFREEPHRVYPRGRLAAHAVGYADRDMAGLAGAERAFDGALSDGDGRPVALSIDMGVQFHLDEVLRRSMAEFRAQAAAGVVMDVRTGEVVGLASLPDFDPNQPAEASAAEALNRITQGRYEMGSVFKAFTVALALETGQATLESGYDATQPLRVGGHVIEDFHAENRWLTLSEIFRHSSNIGSSRIALEAGEAAQRDMLGRLRLMERSPIELYESAPPILPRQWGEAERATVSYGHGIAVSPIMVAAAFAAIANDGVYVAPTLQPVAPGEILAGERVMRSETAQDVLQLMREVVTDGTGRSAEAEGYRVAGKTGTAEKPGRGGYDEDRLISSFAAVFPYDDPQYVVLAMLDEPQGTAETYGYATGGWTAAPAVGEIVRRIAPILGVERDDADGDARAAIARAAFLPGGME